MVHCINRYVLFRSICWNTQTNIATTLMFNKMQALTENHYTPTTSYQIITLLLIVLRSWTNILTVILFPHSERQCLLFGISPCTSPRVSLNGKNCICLPCLTGGVTHFHFNYLNTRHYIQLHNPIWHEILKLHKKKTPNADHVNCDEHILYMYWLL